MDTHNANGNELFNYRAPSVYPVEITPWATTIKSLDNSVDLVPRVLSRTPMESIVSLVFIDFNKLSSKLIRISRQRFFFEIYEKWFEQLVMHSNPSLPIANVEQRGNVVRNEVVHRAPEMVDNVEKRLDSSWDTRWNRVSVLFLRWHVKFPIIHIYRISWRYRSRCSWNVCRLEVVNLNRDEVRIERLHGEDLLHTRMIDRDRTLVHHRLIEF